MGRKREFLKRVERMLNPGLASIDEAAIEAVQIGGLPEIGAAEPAPKQAKSPLDIARFALMLNSINHQFWDVVDGKFERYSHGGLVGAVAMREGAVALLAEAGSFDELSKKLPVLEADVLRCFGPMPDPAGRALALTEAIGPKGKAAAMLMVDAISEEGVWGIAHAQAISTLLPLGFEDPLLKKSQLCLWMAKGMMEAAGHEGPKVDLTCFADYQVPKVLRGLGVLRYGDQLASKVDGGCVMEQDSPMEVAIRAATVVACEKLALAKGLSAPQLDCWLWSKRNEHQQPFHRVRTRRY